MKTSFQVVEHIVTGAKLCQLIYEYSHSADATKNKIENLFTDSSCELTWFDIKSTDTQALTLKNKNDLYVVFQGSESTVDWINNAIFELVPNTSGQGHYHRGFMHACTLSFKDIGAQILNEVSKNPNINIIITGHSLGGAMAMLYCQLLKEANPQLSVTSLVTFGQPRCGNLDFIKSFDTLKIPYFRFVNDGDYVTDVPPPYNTSNWSHTGSGFILKSSSIIPYGDDYEKLIFTRLIILAVTAIRTKLSQTFNAKELSKNHDMALYVRNVLTNLPKINEHVSKQLNGPKIDSPIEANESILS